MRSPVMIILASAGAAAVLAACSDSTSADQRVVNVSFATQASAAAGSALDVTVGDNTNTLVITKAQIVVRKLSLKQSDATTCNDDDNATEASDDCDEVKAGPMLVDLPLTEGATSELTASIPAGTYRELHFQIHRPTSAPADQAFVTANPDFANASIRVEGTYNGTPFVYTSTMTDVFELEFDPPVTLDADNKNVTIRVNLSNWFMNGTTVIDPTSANPGQPFEQVVRNNIRASFRSFEDDDHNGHDDDGVDDNDDH
ncbi:MAG TPA: hypothetical protein VJ867_03495 [Gemmatimonadaceae bacterium]|nr:hypothetical protein [Gemmatimonadaceae bacterium]